MSLVSQKRRARKRALPPGDFGWHADLHYYAIVYWKGGTEREVHGRDLGRGVHQDILHANLVIIRHEGVLYRLKDRFASFPPYNVMTEEEADRRVEDHLHVLRSINEDGSYRQDLVREILRIIPGPVVARKTFPKKKPEKVRSDRSFLRGRVTP